VGWGEALAFALLNWLYDCLVLVTSMLALHVAVPWRGIFVIYGLTQIAAVVPITPGGVVVVEGTLAGLLSAYGVHAEGAFATVLLYRLISFWALVPIGWGLWAFLNLREEKGLGTRRPHPWAVHVHPAGASAVEPAEQAPRAGEPAGQDAGAVFSTATTDVLAPDASRKLAGGDGEQTDRISAGLFHRLAAPRPCEGCDEQEPTCERLEPHDKHRLEPGDMHGQNEARPEPQDAGSPR
jgi:Lysylphosphatidylglycerol synthase TM region